MSLPKVFWPDDMPHSAGGTIYGWRLHNTWICVATVVTKDSRISPRGSIRDLSLDGANILACVDGDQRNPGSIEIKPTSMTWGAQRDAPDRPPSYHFISYHPPNTKRLRYLTLRPISFTSTSVIDSKEQACASVLDLQEATCAGNTGRDESGYETAPSGMEEAPAGSGGGDPLEEIIRRINQAHDVRKVLRGSKPMDRAGTMRKPQTSAATPAITTSLVNTWQAIATFIVLLCDLPLWPPFGTQLPWLDNFTQPFRLLHLSQTFRQLSLRAQQARSLPVRWSALHAPRHGSLDRSSEGVGVTSATTNDLRNHSIRYIDFYNTVWLLINDAIIGWTIGAILRSNASLATDLIMQGFEGCLKIGLQESLMFLDNWPVGLKLNTPLSALFSHTFGFMAETASCLASSCFAYLPTILWIASIVSSFGATFFLCICADVASLATIHLRMATLAMSIVYKWNMSGLYSLWNLFRGKRWNVMRLRVDRYDYDNDQLFLGTLLFTILLFLTPTIWAYYTFFASLRLALLGLHLTIETALAFLNAFPLFALILRLKEPSRLPGGVFFTVSTTGGHRGMPCSQPYLQLRGKSISFAEVFAQFWASWALLMTDYSPLRLLKGLVSGDL